MDRLSKFKRFYTTTAIHWLSCTLLLVLANLLAWLLLRPAGSSPRPAPRDNPVARRYPGIELLSFYPGWKQADLDQLLAETWSRPVVFEPYTHFKEAAVTGRFVNVAPAGYRVGVDQGPWPPKPLNYNVFLLGGSTVFGYGLPDDQTVGSQLQRLLPPDGGRPARVYNFGRGFYYSTQEAILLQRLLQQGQIPDVVVCLDGLNEFLYPRDLPAFSALFERQFNDPASSRPAPVPHGLAQHLPLAQLLASYAGWGSAVSPRTTWQPTESLETNRLIPDVLELYWRNQRLISGLGRSYGFRTLFVWQPSPTYDFDLKHHPFAQRGFGAHAVTQAGYQAMWQHLQAHGAPADFLWAADLQHDATGPLYVDLVHYNSELARRVAQRIADGLRRLSAGGGVAP